MRQDFGIKLMKKVFVLTILIIITVFLYCVAGLTDVKKTNVLYVFAHEDDEVDVTAKIASDLSSGKEVYCVWVTNGDKAGDPAVRQNESRTVMKLINVPQENLFFLGYPDQNAYRHLEDIVNDISKIVKKIAPSEIMSHAYEGGNIDHDVVSFVSTIAARRTSAVHLEFPDSNVYEGRTQLWKFLPDDKNITLYTKLTDDSYKLKMKIMRMYPSQNYLSAYHLGVDWKSLRRDGEPYRMAPEYDYTSPPASELRYLATSKGTATFDMFKEAVEFYLIKN